MVGGLAACQQYLPGPQIRRQKAMCCDSVAMRAVSRCCQLETLRDERWRRPLSHRNCRGWTDRPGLLAKMGRGLRDRPPGRNVQCSVWQSPEFWGEVQPPASLKGLDIPSRRADFVALGNRAEGRRSEWETRPFVEEPMLSTGLHFASESTISSSSTHVLLLGAT